MTLNQQTAKAMADGFFKFAEQEHLQQYSGRLIISGLLWPIDTAGGFLLTGCPDAWTSQMAKMIRMVELDCPDARMAQIAWIPMASGHGQRPWPAAMASGHGQ